MLLELTQIINFLLLGTSLWLGLYILTQSPRRLVAWLTGCMLFSVATLALNLLLTLAPTALPESFLVWPDSWQISGLRKALSAWLNGWSLTPVIVLWHHVTVLMRPGRVTRWRFTRIVGGYLLIAWAMLSQAFTPHLFAIIPGNPLYIPKINIGILYPIFLSLIFLYAVITLINLINLVREAQTDFLRLQYITLVIATIVLGLTGPLSVISSLSTINMPIVVLSILLELTVLLMGFGVIKYSALIEGRTTHQDFFYSAVVIISITAVYSLGVGFIVWGFDLPRLVFVFAIALIIISHTVVDAIRRGLEERFFRYKFGGFRTNLQQLNLLSEQKDQLTENLAKGLEAICNSVNATFGLILLFEAEIVKPLVAFQCKESNFDLTINDLQADDVLPLDPGQFGEPLDEAALLIPLYVDDTQLGVLILGRPENGIGYTRADIEQLLYPTDQLTNAIWVIQREAAHIREVNQKVKTSLENLDGPSTEVSVEIVEKALRKMDDYAYLGKVPLVNLDLVQTRLSPNEITHLAGCRKSNL